MHKLGRQENVMQTSTKFGGVTKAMLNPTEKQETNKPYPAVHINTNLMLSDKISINAIFAVF